MPQGQYNWDALSDIVKAIAEGSASLGGNTFFDVGSLGAEAVASPSLFLRGFGNPEAASEFAQRKQARREQLPELGVSPSTERIGESISNMFVDPEVGILTSEWDMFRRENPEEAEALTQYATDPRVGHTLEAAGLAAPAFLRAGKAARNANFIENLDRTPVNKETGAVVLTGGDLKAKDFFGESALRDAKPGIYKAPAQLAKEAEAQIAPESPLLRQLFNTSRAELNEIATRAGNKPGMFHTAPNPKGSYSGKAVMTPANSERIVNALTEMRKYAPKLHEGMGGWYVLDPLKDKFIDIYGKDRGLKEFSDFNALLAMNSPGAPVDWEIPRGSSAYSLNRQGRIEDWFEYGGIERGRPPGIGNFPGHPYHSTAHGGPVRKYLDTGDIQSKEPKVPLYRQASEAPELGFQTDTPVPDAHWSRAVGLADVRKSKKFDQSASGTEMYDLAPWWREQVAAPSGMESVPAQARAWGLYAPQTGVETKIGAPKLELIAEAVNETAKRLSITPEQALEKVIMGETYAGY